MPRNGRACKAMIGSVSKHSVRSARSGSLETFKSSNGENFEAPLGQLGGDAHRAPSRLKLSRVETQKEVVDRSLPVLGRKGARCALREIGGVECALLVSSQPLSSLPLLVLRAVIFPAFECPVTNVLVFP